MIKLNKGFVTAPTISANKLMLGQVYYALLALGVNLGSGIAWFSGGVALTSTNPFLGAAFCASLLAWSVAVMKTPDIPFWRTVNVIYSILVIIFGVISHLKSPFEGIGTVLVIILNTAGSTLLILNSLLSPIVSTNRTLKP